MPIEIKELGESLFSKEEQEDSSISTDIWC
jgi:hypothetical protein